ncbi:YibE/F family protein [Corynebacterium sp. 335C]
MQRSSLLSARTVAGTVVEETRGACGSPSAGHVFTGAPEEPPTIAGAPAPQQCDRAIVRIDEGADAGSKTLIETAGVPGDPDLHPGEEVRLAVEELPAPAAPGAPGAPTMMPGAPADPANPAPAPGQPGNPAQAQAPPATNFYTFMDMERTTPLLVWLAVAVIGIVLVGAWRGVRSLVGLGVTLVVIAGFLLPALLRGGPTTALAVVAGAIIVFVAVPLVHGVNWKSAASMAGTLLALAISAFLAQAAIASTALRGLADEDNLLIHIHFPAVDVTGLLLAGFIVGALGVLNDVTIAQASTVTELAEADGDASAAALFRSAMRVGQDHIASMVYTLVLTYTGATLPLLLLITASDRPLGHMLTSDVVATELLRSGVGALGLVLAVPLTTAIAAITAHGRRTRPAAARTRRRRRAAA